MSNQPKRILVLGATGHIGQAIVRRALDCGHEVTATTRQENPEPLQKLKVNLVRIDESLRCLSDVAKGHDLLVDAAAPYRLVPDTLGAPGWQSQVDSAVARTEHIINVALHNGMRLVHVSSCTTVARSMSPSQSAAAVWRRSISPYFEAKAAMERVVIAAARKGLKTVIVNPGAFLGPWEYRRVEASFVRSVLEQRFPMVLDQAMCVIDVRDVAEGIDLALSQDLYGHPIPLSGHNLTLRDLAMRTAQLAGLMAAAPFLLHPDAVAAAVYWIQRVSMAFGITPPENLGFIPLIEDVLPMPPSPEQISLGVKIRPLESTLRDSIQFHRNRSFG
jgi:dihydroflavonol-4-reductase